MFSRHNAAMLRLGDLAASATRYKGHRRLATRVVGLTDHAGADHCRVLAEQRLDFWRETRSCRLTFSISLRRPRKCRWPLGVQHSDIAGVKPAVRGAPPAVASGLFQ